MYPIFAHLYLAIMARLQAQVPAIRYIDQDLGQLENYEIRPAVSWPCLLIDFDAATYTQLGMLAQDGTVQVALRLGFAPFSQAHSLAPLAVRQQALQYYQLEHEIFMALQGWAPDSEEDEPLCQPLMRTQAATERREDDLRVRIITFTTTFFDTAATPPTTPATPPLSLAFTS